MARDFFRRLFTERAIIFLSLILSLPISFFIPAFFYSISPKNYSLRNLFQPTIILSIIIFWIVLAILLSKKELIHGFFQRIRFATKNSFTLIDRLLLLVLTIVSIWILAFLEVPETDFFREPVFIYHVEIMPGEKSEGGICVWDIKNSYGHIQRYNETIKNLAITGDWQKNIGHCVLSLDDGEFGKIAFDNQGPINDSLRFWVSFGSINGELEVISEPGTTRLISDYGFNTFPIGGSIIRRIASWGFYGGLISLMLVFLIALLGSLYGLIRRKTQSIKNYCDTSIYPKLKVIWSELDQNRIGIVSLAILFIFGALLKIFIFNKYVFGPVHFGDETIYWQSALGLSNGSVSSSKFFRLPPLYPISILPAFLLVDSGHTYSVVKILNSIFLTSAIFPVYFISRRFFKNNISLLIALLTTLNPLNIIIPGRILTENLFYPLLLWAALFATFNIFRKNRIGLVFEDFLLGCLISFVYLTRQIGLVLIPGFLLIWWLKISSDDNSIFKITWTKIHRMVIVLIPIIVLVGGWLLIGVKNGRTQLKTTGILLAYNSNPDQLTLSRLVMWAIFYLAYTILIVTPFIPLLIASLSKFNLRDWKSEKNRWIIASIIITGLILIASILHSWKMGYNYPIPVKLQGRYLLYFGPLLLITSFLHFKTDSKMIHWIKLLVFSFSSIIISYAVLFLGYFYLRGPMNISASSPDGDFIEMLGNLFVIIAMITAFLITVIISQNRKRSAFLLVFSLLCAFYMIGDLRLLDFLGSSPLQVSNSQISHLLDFYQTGEQEKNGKTSDLVFNIPPDTLEDEILWWKSTLLFYGYEESSFIKDQYLENDKSVIFNVRFYDQLIGLRSISKSEYDESDASMYEFAGNYFDFFPIDFK